MGTDAKIIGNEKGIATIYIALMLVALVALAGIVMDFGYMYITKGQLQNAADSAALAGAAKMKSAGTGTANATDTVQAVARTEAITFAAKNNAAKSSVVIANNNSNVMSSDNDIAVGNWNGTSFSPGTTPVNAMKVRARRTSDSPGGQVPTFLGRVIGWNQMGAAADAIAALPLRANGYLSICQESCSGISSDPSSPTILSPPREYTRDPGTDPGSSFAWTSLLDHVSSTNDISPLVCSDQQPNVSVCGKQIYTTQGTSSELFKQMESTFNDPNYDKENKEFSGGEVTGWWVLVPVTLDCNPANQTIEPFNVWGYAWIRIISVCDTGGGNPCRPYHTNHCAYPHEVVIDRIACVSCADSPSASGDKTLLVK
jgi:Flp pilus assembly protein TadG